MGYIGIIIIIILAYSLEDTLLVHFARKNNGLITGIIRNITLIFTGMVVFLFTKDVDRSLLQQHYLTIIVTGVLGMVSVFANFEALRCLPVGIGVTYKRAVTIGFSLLIGLTFFKETIHLSEWIALFIIVIGSLSLNLMKSNSTLPTTDKKKGIILMCISGIATAGLWTTFKIYSRDLDPLLAGYILESSIGACMFIFFIIKTIQGTYSFKILFSKETISIGLISMFALLGSILTSIALKQGGIGITSALMSLIIPCSGIIGLLIFKEKIELKQRIAIFVIILGIVIIQVS